MLLSLWPPLPLPLPPSRVRFQTTSVRVFSMVSAPSSSLATNATSSGSSPAKFVLNLPPGYHFFPTDDELVVHYLRPRLANHPPRLPIFVSERILDYHPDALIEKYRQYGEDRWFFFTARERKHLGGNRPNRTTPGNGHWNATGSIRPVRSAAGVLVGCCRTLVFYEASRSRSRSRRRKKSKAKDAEEEEEEEAKAKDAAKTDWTMYEYESLNSEAEFEALRSGKANKIDVVVLCTIQKKKNSPQEGKEGDAHETNKRTKKMKTKGEDLLELEAAPAAGDVVEQGSSGAGTTGTEGQDEDDVQGAVIEAAEPLPEQEYKYHAPAGVENFNVDPNGDMTYYYLTNSLSPVPMHPQQTVMVPATGGNHTVMLQESYFIDHSNSQSFHVQETPPQEFLQYSDTKMAALGRGGNAMDHMLQNWTVNSGMTPYQAPPLPGTQLSPVRSKLNAWWGSHCQEKLPGREVSSSYVTNSLSVVPTPPQKKVVALAARGHDHTVMHQQNYSNHSMNMRNSQFYVQGTLPQEEFLPYSNTKTAAAPLGGGSIMEHHMLQNRIVNMASAAEAHTFNNGFCPGPTNSNYRHAGGDYGHLSTRMDHPEPSSYLFPSQQAQGQLLLNNQVSLNHQNSAASSMVGYDKRNDMGLAPKIV